MALAHNITGTHTALPHMGWMHYRSTHILCSVGLLFVVAEVEGFETQFVTQDYNHLYSISEKM